MDLKYKAVIAAFVLALIYIVLFHVLGIVGVKVFYSSEYLMQCGFWTFGL